MKSVQDNLRAGPRLSSLTLEPAHALLPPFGSHLVGFDCRWLATARGLEAG